ncbi:MAG TPA: DUF6285 domain-containing protein [Candidatus Binataceae bacterium]|nr:DUF6285 domain-containing protein [Candidatus Binataceae bacterium]
MPRSIPDRSTLLTAAIKYLEEELMPTLSGYHRFQTRVTANVLNTVRRELDLREAQESAERSRLMTMIGHHGSVEELNQELCELIRTDLIDLDNPHLRNHIRQSLADALAVNNPRWIAE